MEKIYINDFVSIKEISNILSISENEFIKKIFLKGIIIKKNEILNFENAQKLCNLIFNIKVYKKVNINIIEKKIKNFFYVSVIGNVNSGKTTLIDFIFKKNMSLNEIGKITQFISVYETFFKKKKIFFFDLPGHKIFKKIIETYTNISNLIFLIISIEEDKEKIFKEIYHIIKNNNYNLIICINKIDKIKNRKFFFENFKNFKISSINGYGVKNMIYNSINFFLSISKTNFIDICYDGFIVNSYIKNNDFFVTLFLLNNNIYLNDCIFFKNEKIILKNLYLNNIKIEKCSAPCIITIKNIFFPIDLFFSKKENERLKIKEIYREKYYNLINYYIKSDNHTIAFSILDFYNNLKFNNKIEIKISLGILNEKDINFCKKFKYKIIIISSKLNNSIKKIIFKENIYFKEYYLVNDLINYFLEKYNFLKNEIILGELIIKEIFPCGKNKKIAGCEVIEGVLYIEKEIKIFKELKLIFQGKINTLKIKNNNTNVVKKNEECGLNIKNFNNIEIGMKIICIDYV